MEPPKTLFPDKEFFSMGEASRIVRIPAYTLRYWESRLRLLRPTRREGGHRRYTKRDLEMVLRIKDLLQHRHMTLAGARRVLAKDLRPSRNAGGPADSPAPAAGVAGDGTASRLLRDLRTDLESILTDLSQPATP